MRSLAAVFNETVAKLARLLRSQGEFVADASHELRTPLTALRLRLESLPPSRDRDAALHEADRLRDLVDGLLALARADAGARGVCARRRVGAHARARRGVAAARGRARCRPRLAARRPAAGARRAGTARAGARQPPRQRARGVARRAGRSRCRPRGAPWVELHVRDEGPGLTAEQRERAFDRFWRAGSGAGGSGLGLAIVRRLVAADEGEVELREASGGGVDAVVRLRPA